MKFTASERNITSEEYLRFFAETIYVTEKKRKEKRTAVMKKAVGAA